MSAPCAICGDSKIPGTNTEPWEMGMTRVWSAIDDYKPVHVQCERRVLRHSSLTQRLLYRGPRRRWLEVDWRPPHPYEGWKEEYAKRRRVWR